MQRSSEANPEARTDSNTDVETAADAGTRDGLRALEDLRDATIRHLDALGEVGRAKLPDGLLAPFVDEPIRAVTVRRIGPWRVSLAPMMFNTRIVLTAERHYPRTWVSGYCYDPGPLPLLAALAWDPISQARPEGWKKIAAEDTTTFLREAAAWREQNLRDELS